MLTLKVRVMGIQCKGQNRLGFGAVTNTMNLSDFKQQRFILLVIGGGSAEGLCFLLSLRDQG